MIYVDDDVRLTLTAVDLSSYVSTSLISSRTVDITHLEISRLLTRYR